MIRRQGQREPGRRDAEEKWLTIVLVVGASTPSQSESPARTAGGSQRPGPTSWAWWPRSVGAPKNTPNTRRQATAKSQALAATVRASSSQEGTQPDSGVPAKRGVERLLGLEAEGRPYARQGQRGQNAHDERDRHLLPQPAQLADVPRVGGVLHDPRHQEQRPLVHGVGEHLQGVLPSRAQAVEHGDQTQRGHGGLGQDPLEVGVQERLHGAQEERRQADGHQDAGPGGRGPKMGRSRPRRKIARLHHGGGVKVGGDRGRGHHGPGQPEMERPLGRLGHGAEHDQQQRRHEERRPGQPVLERRLSGQGAEAEAPRRRFQR